MNSVFHASQTSIITDQPSLSSSQGISSTSSHNTWLYELFVSVRDYKKDVQLKTADHVWIFVLTLVCDVTFIDLLFSFCLMHYTSLKAMPPNLKLVLPIVGSAVVTLSADFLITRAVRYFVSQGLEHQQMQQRKLMAQQEFSQKTLNKLDTLQNLGEHYLKQIHAQVEQLEKILKATSLKITSQQIPQNHATQLDLQYYEIQWTPSKLNNHSNKSNNTLDQHADQQLFLVELQKEFIKLECIINALNTEYCQLEENLLHNLQAQIHLFSRQDRYYALKTQKDEYQQRVQDACDHFGNQHCLDFSQPLDSLPTLHLLHQPSLTEEQKLHCQQAAQDEISSCLPQEPLTIIITSPTQ